MPVPTPVEPQRLDDYLEAMARAVFTSGIKWDVIDAKWDGIRDAFEGFDPERVAAFTPEDVDRLMRDARVIRNRRKLEAIVDDAGALIATDREFGGFDAYLRSFGGDNEALVKDLHRRFAFLGPSVAHFFLFRVGFDLPSQDAWAREHFGGEYRHHHHLAHAAGAGE